MRNYYRQFVTLLQERPGHAMPGKQAVGRIVIEARDDVARATVYIQDLSPQDTYRLAFISRAGEANLGVILGSIIVDEKGRYEGKFEFDRANIGGSRITCEGIDACVVFLGGGEEEFAAPLAGYRTQPFSWRVNLSFPDGKEESPILEVKQVEEIVAEEVVVEEEIEEAEDEVEEEEEEEERAVLGISEVAAEVEDVPPPVYDFDIVEILDEEVRAEEVADDDDLQVLFQGENVVEIFGNSDRFPNAQWVVTSLQHAGAVDDDILLNPLVMECCDKHKHILLGRNVEDGRSTYILGIPDIYDISQYTEEHEFIELFDSFRMCNPNDPIRGAHGYWLKEL